MHLSDFQKLFKYLNQNPLINELFEFENFQDTNFEIVKFKDSQN